MYQQNHANTHKCKNTQDLLNTDTHYSYPSGSDQKPPVIRVLDWKEPREKRGSRIEPLTSPLCPHGRSPPTPGSPKAHPAPSGTYVWTYMAAG